MRCCLVFDDLVGQDEVVSTLTNMLERDTLSHAYLFVGPAGLGKTQAAYGLAQALMCDKDGAGDGVAGSKGACGICNTCRRITKAIHPDVQSTAPIGASGYLVDQIRDIIHQVSRAPVESKHKVFILFGADQLNESSANAFLKTLEEPPGNTTFILIVHSLGTIIPTIRSRCRIVRFKPLAEYIMIELLQARTGCSESDARTALAATSNVLREAETHIKSIGRQNTRSEAIFTYRNLAALDDREVIEAAGRIMDLAVEPLGEMRKAHEKEIDEQSDFLSRGALTDLEKSHKRQLSAYQLRCMREVYTVFASVLRDVVCMTVGADALASNADVLQDSTRIAEVLAPADVALCLEAIARAATRTDAHVDPKLALEVMLFEIRKVFLCHKQ